MKIICPYCNEENEVDINGGDSFICKDKNCNKKVMIAKVDNKSTYHWAIILLVLFIFISINAFRSNSALKNVNEELSKNLSSKTEELNKEIAKSASESLQLKNNNESLGSVIEQLSNDKIAKDSEIIKLKQEKSDLDSKNKQLEEDKEKLKEDLRKAINENSALASKSQQLESDIENYVLAKKYMDEGKYEEAVSIFNNLDSFLDSKAQIVICNENIKYSNAINHLEKKEYDTAKAIFESLGDFKDSKEQMKVCDNNIKYNNALSLLNSKKYSEASELFKELADFKDSKNKMDECNCNINLNKIKEVEVGDIVTFGSYEQDLKKDGKEPIEWIVLEKNASEAFLLSKYGLESMNYHDSILNTNWEKCSIRKWLNKDFYEEAFKDFEKNHIKTVENNYADFLYSIDKVFLLSWDEFNKRIDIFKENIKCEPTDYVKSRSDVSENAYNYNVWRLRSIGNSVANAYNHAIYYGYKYNKNKYFLHFSAFCQDNVKNKGLIRPAIWVKFGEE